ncbi:hypothetical protein CBM2626_B110327 [Cupriavidus taiwanensis]|nr:hypothetical protein CBM2626_B110327 [Cupriavidus taiwanensis]
MNIPGGVPGIAVKRKHTRKLHYTAWGINFFARGPSRIPLNS